MPIRLRQKLESFCPNKIYLDVLEINPETGVGERKLVDQCIELPDSNTMDLGLMIKAGVPLQEVDSKLLNPVGTVGLGAKKEDNKKAEEKKDE